MTRFRDPATVEWAWLMLAQVKVRGTLMTLYRTLFALLFGCLLALCGSTTNLAHYVVDSRQLFFCLVCSLLEKYKNCMHWNVPPEALPGSATYWDMRTMSI
jgi:hypothetical protein